MWDLFSNFLVGVFLVFILLQPRSFAAEGDSHTTDWKNEALDNFQSPVTTNAKYALLVGAGLVGGLLIFEDQIVDPVQSQTTKDKPLGQYSKFGDLNGQGLPNALYVLGMYGYGTLNSDSNAKQNSVSMLQATFYSVAVTTGLKYSVREKRPDSDARDSFPSGHTTAAFSFASYVSCRHSLGWGIAAYSLATFVGFSRINDNRHYLHDVVAGAAIGTAYGLGICLAENERSDQQKPESKANWYLLPSEDGMSIGMTFRY